MDISKIASDDHHHQLAIEMSISLYPPLLIRRLNWVLPSHLAYCALWRSRLGNRLACKRFGVQTPGVGIMFDIARLDQICKIQLMLSTYSKRLLLFFKTLATRNDFQQKKPLIQSNEDDERSKWFYISLSMILVGFFLANGTVYACGKRCFLWIHRE